MNKKITKKISQGGNIDVFTVFKNKANVFISANNLTS